MYTWFNINRLILILFYWKNECPIAAATKGHKLSMALQIAMEPRQKKRKEGRAKIRSQVEAWEGQSRMLL